MSLLPLALTTASALSFISERDGNREVYTISGTVRQGNSGGLMINRTGEVIGVVFGAAVDDDDTGFVMTANEVSRQLKKVGYSTKVPTGSCAK